METNRRSFLKGLLTVAAVSCVPVVVDAMPRVPRIVGDGVHDDWAGLQAAIDGKPFICEDNLILAREGSVTINGGDFLISKTLRVSVNNNSRVDFVGNRFTITDRTPDTPVLYFEYAADFGLANSNSVGRL
jgi:hypothetical protein